ncbi:MAG: hypothetical protein E7527_05125 [Ruminococcaceae bacterium]|nr:hypothetical protein [Oscillospiraceae bacterium]
MDDLNEKLNRLLSDPEGLAKIQAAMTALGAGAETAPPPPPPVPEPGGGGPDLAALTKLVPLLSGLNQESEDTRLLQALRPYLHGARAGRLDDTMRLLKLVKLLPLLQEQGILSGLGGGNGGR